jgi:integrase
MQTRRENDFLFPGQRRAKLSNAAMLKLVRRMDSVATTHGFRSTFRDWCADLGHVAPELAEAALAHSAGTSVTQAYLRTSMLERRRPVMAQWADYCGQVAPAPGEVVPLQARRL